MVEELWPPVERTDAREPAADEPEVDRRNQHARRHAGQDGSPARKRGGEHDAPGERDGDMARTPGDDRATTNGAGRLEDVAARHECERC